MSRERANDQLYPAPLAARIRADRALELVILLALGPCLGLLDARHVQAQAASEAAGATAREDRAQRARVHFERAMEHYRERRYREAIHEFQLSRAEVPNADLWFNIGRAHEQLGEYEPAIENYRLYLRDRVEAPDALEVQQRVDELMERVQAIKATSPRAGTQGVLAVKAEDDGALVLLDGERLGVSPIDRLLHVAPGRHRLDASREGFIPLRAEVEVQPGGLSVAYVELQPRSPPEAAGAPRLWTWVAAAASAGALVASGALGLAALGRRDAGALPEARRLAQGSNIALAGGFSLAIGAALLYFIEGEASEPMPQRNPLRPPPAGARGAGRTLGSVARSSVW